MSNGDKTIKNKKEAINGAKKTVQKRRSYKDEKVKRKGEKLVCEKVKTKRR